MNDWMNRNKWWFGPIALIGALVFVSVFYQLIS
jgi:hypothetical protein